MSCTVIYFPRILNGTAVLDRRHSHAASGVRLQVGWGNFEDMVDLDENELFYYELTF
jgi:hypothetical protein